MSPFAYWCLVTVPILGVQLQSLERERKEGVMKIDLRDADLV